MTVSTRHDLMITDLFDTVTSFDCRTYEDIATASKILSVDDVAATLRWIRTPSIQQLYGWSIPHVPRGRPSAGEAYRYRVVGLNGDMLSTEDISLVRRGALSTMRSIYSVAINEANALRLTVPMVADALYQKRASDMAKVLDGLAVQADNEAQRLKAMIPILVTTP